MSTAALAVAVVAFVGPGPTPSSSPPLQARVSACQVGPVAWDRSATFKGSMPAVPGTRRMAMRFDLLRRAYAVGPFMRVVVPGLGTWHRSAIGKPGFVFSQRVEQLVPPASYRAVVRFRWYGRGGRLLRA